MSMMGDNIKPGQSAACLHRRFQPLCRGNVWDGERFRFSCFRPRLNDVDLARN